MYKSMCVCITTTGCTTFNELAVVRSKSYSALCGQKEHILC